MYQFDPRNNWILDFFGRNTGRIVLQATLLGSTADLAQSILILAELAELLSRWNTES